MYGILYLLLIIGIIMIVDGIYREEIEKLKKDKKIEYKFIPRSTYNDMLFHKHTTPQYDNIFTQQMDSRGAGRVI